MYYISHSLKETEINIENNISTVLVSSFSHDTAKGFFYYLFIKN